MKVRFSFILDIENACDNELQLYIRYGYAWKFADEEFCPKRFALTEDDCYDAADSMITERDFYARADAIEAAIELQRDREHGLL